MSTLPRTLVLVATLMFGLAAAQPLAALAPADTVLTLSIRSQAPVVDSLGRDLAELDWAGAGATLDRLLTMTADNEFVTGMGELRSLLDTLAHPNNAMTELDTLCPAAAEALTTLDLGRLADDYLLTVSISRFNPMPALTAFARVTPEARTNAEALQAALVDCFGGTTLMQDDTPLHVLGDGGELPLTVAAVGEVFMLSTNPEALRGAIRLAGGSDEPSLASTALWQAQGRLADDGFGFSLDFAALADAAEAFRGMLGAEGSEPAVAAAIDRTLATLRTLGGVAARIGTSAEGLVSESVWAVNPAGGDTALAELLLCRTCAVSRPYLAPPGSVTITSEALPLRELTRYLDSWLATLAPLIGDDRDLRTLAADELGLDLDRALLDWIGDEFHSATLTPISPDLRSLLYGSNQVIILPVSSESQARAGLEELGRALAPFASELMRGAASLPGRDGGPALPEASGAFAVREERYQDVTITHLQASLNLDVGVAFVGNHLVIGFPARAVESVISTFHGNRTLGSDQAYRQALGDAPSGATALTYSDTGASLAGFSELALLVSQPIAFGLETALADATLPSGGGDLGLAPLTGVTPTPLTVGSTEGSLATLAGNSGEVADVYEIQGVAAGEKVTVAMQSDTFDTFLYLVDGDTLNYLDSNDDAPDTTRSELSFTAGEGRRYWLQVTSFSGTDTGPYLLSLDTSTPSAAVEPPSFAELLELTELLPKALAVLADHVGVASGYRYTDGDLVISRHLTRVRW